jgi:ParB family chromosome partitioning protein
MNVHEIPIDLIDVAERRRSEFGDIAALAKGIERVGLLHPIVVDRNGSGRYRLIAGERRLKAIKLLKRETIAAQLRGHMTDAEMRDVELEENENRKNLTEGERARTFESSQRIVRTAKRAEQVLGGIPPKPVGPKGGRPSNPASKEAVAEAVGISRRSLLEAEQHVETAERFPWMKGSEWRQSHVLAVREQMEKLPESERDSVAGVLACARLMDPALAVELVEKMAAKPKRERTEIYALSQSESARDRSLALTKAKELPPMPDPRIMHLTAASSAIQQAIDHAPSDGIADKLRSIHQDLKTIRRLLTKPPERTATVQ